MDVDKDKDTVAPVDDLDKDHDSGQAITFSRYPDYPHPAVDSLEELNFDILPDGFCVIEYGVRRTGKTVLTCQQCENIKDRFDFAYLFSGTAEIHKGDKNFANFDMIVDDAKFDGYDEEALIRIMERQRAVMKHNNQCKNARDKKPNKTLLIFDDFVHDKRIRYSTVFTELPILGRHLDISCIFLTQGYSQVASGGLNKATRENADLVLTFQPRNENNKERISEWYLTKNKVENMWFINSACQEKHRALAINLSDPSLTEFDEYCYTNKGPEEIPKYELGKVQWKLFHAERKRQKKAALQASIENERSCFLSMSSMEKQQRIGQATGLPDSRRGKLSLFDALNASNGI